MQDAVVQYVDEVADLDLKIRVRLNRGPNNRCAGETVALHHEARIDTLTQHRAADRANGYVVFQMAEGIIPKTLFAEILRRVDGLRQWEMGVLPDEEWDVWTRIICINRSSAGDRALWPGNKQTLIPSFIAWVEQNCKTAENLEGVVPQQVLPERN